MHEKEERKEKCYLKVVVPMVVGLDQVLLPNLSNMDFQRTHRWWPLFYLQFYHPRLCTCITHFVSHLSHFLHLF